MRVAFTMKDSAGRSWTHVPPPGGNREEDLRFGTIVGGFRDQAISDELAASWAARMFALYPDAEEVLVRWTFMTSPP